MTQGIIPDFVYEKGFKLLSIPELEKFIIENKHLPDFPSADECKSKDLDVGEIQLLQWQKLEEYSMYIIQLKKENDALKLRVERLEAK